MNSYSGTEESNLFVNGFSVLFKECLRVRSEDNILVIFDEAFERFLEPLVSFLISEKLLAAFVSVPKKYQRALIAWSSGEEYEIDVPRGIASACGESSVIVNCLDGELDTSRLRGAILNRFRPKECRFAHIPGLSEEILVILTRTPTEEIVRAAETVAWALGEAKTGRLVSFDANGREYHLQLELDGWDNEPMMSPGVIYPNSWGNAPPGEVFCCPDHEKVTGFVCINGSVPGKALVGQDATVIEFEGGHIVRWWPDSTAVAEFLREQQALAHERDDKNWNAFAEMGIGLNRAVEMLTGNSLLDEKALRTIHVAIGSNRSFGHKIKSYIHADLVITEPTLELDGVTVMDKGVLRIEWLERLRRHVQVEPLLLPRKTKILFKGAKLEFERGRALRRLMSAGRVGYVPMLELSADSWLEDVIRDVREGVPVSYSQLEALASGDRLDYALAVLHHYRALLLEKVNGQNSTSNHPISAGRSRLREYGSGSG